MVRGRVWTMGKRYPGSMMFCDEGGLFAKQDWAYPDIVGSCGFRSLSCDNWRWLKYLGHVGD